MASDRTTDAPRLYLNLAGDLSGQIRSGALAAGERLPSERALMKQYDVSRSVVREALIVMQLEGLVEIRHGAGTFVSARSAPMEGTASGFSFDGTGPFELINARIIVEGETAALAAQSASAEDIARIRSAVDQMIEDREPFMLRHGADKAFHNSVAAASRNGALAVMVAAMWERYDRLMIDDVSERARQPGNHQMAVADHSRILACIDARDSEGARLAMRQHLERVRWFFSAVRN